MTISKPSPPPKIFKLAFLLQGITSFFALTIYAYLGIFTRLGADDYYHSNLLRNGNSIWQASLQKYLHVSNRYANLYLFSFDKWIGIEFFSAFLIFLWLIGLIWLLKSISKFSNLHLSYLSVFSIPSTLIFFSILQTPNLYQTIYWLSGTVTYFSPIVLFTLSLAGFFAILTHAKGFQSVAKTLFFTFLSAFIMFFIGGLSETVGALHIGILFLLIIAIWFLYEKKNRGFAIMLLSGAVIGAFASLVVMAFSPANAIRSNAPPLAIPIFIERVISYPFLFIVDTLKTLPLPSFFLFFTAFLIFSVISIKITEKKHLYWGLALTALVVYGLIAMSFAPSIYGLGYPEARVRFPARVVLSFGLFIEGALLGQLVGGKKKIFLAAMLIGAALYPLRGAYQAYQHVTAFQTYANAWDTREAYILSQREKGILDISVPPIDAMGGVKEFDVNPQHWVNQSAAFYYGVDSISVHDLDLSYGE